jgi:polar amino acid transport system substrate-binding protein
MRRARLLIAVALLALAAAAPAQAADPLPTLVPDTLTVGLQMPTQGFQVGSVSGSDVVYARGLEVDLARALAQRMGIPNVRFVQERSFARIFTTGPKAWDVLFAQATITKARERIIDFSVPYLQANQGVLLREELGRTPKTLAALRGLKLCAEDGTTGEETISQRIHPTTRTTLVSSLRLLLQRLADRRCDAIVSDAPILGAERAAVPDSYGALAGQIRTNERYGAVLAQGSPLKPAVNEALKGLIADGTVGQLSKRWLTVDVSKLRILR